MQATTTGFHGNDTETFYVTPSGKVWVVQSEDDLPRVREIDSLPTDATSVDSMVTPEEAIEWLGQVEAEGGEVLLETAD